MAPSLGTRSPLRLGARPGGIGLLTGLVAGLLAAACSSTATNSPTTTNSPATTSTTSAPTTTSPPGGAHSVEVPITIVGGQGTVQGARPTVMVSVGRSRPVPLLLDTGSSGLRIFSADVMTGAGSGVSVSSTPSKLTYSGGQRFVGVVAEAVVKIGSVATVGAVPFLLVQTANCARRMPGCKAAGGMAGWMAATGTDGILGIGMMLNGNLTSPLPAMPAGLRRSWSIHLRASGGQLTLGASPPGHVAAEFHLRSTGHSSGRHVGATALWADASLSLCLSVGTVSGCAPTLLDTGTFAIQLSGVAFQRVPVVGTGAAAGKHVASGEAVAFSIGGSPKPFWSFTSGPFRSENLLLVRPGAAFINAGVQPYFDFTVTYDDVAGTITLSTPAAGPVT